MYPRAFFNVIKRAAIAWNDNNAPSYGAALAYYTVFSLAPVLLIAIDMASLVVGSDAARDEVGAQLEQTLGSAIANALMVVLDNAHQTGANTSFTVVGMCVLLLGASGVFVQLQATLNLIWKTQPPPRIGNIIVHFLKYRLLSFGAVLVTGLLLLVSLIVSSVLATLHYWVPSFPGSGLMWQGVAILVSFAFMTLQFALVFKLLPDLPVEWRDVWIGAVLTAVLFALGQQLLGVYLSEISPASAYGAAGSLVVLLVWVYYSAQIVLFGAEFTHAFAEMHGSKNLAYQSARGLPILTCKYENRQPAAR